MDVCTHCQSSRFLVINEKCNDLRFAEIDGQENDGYVPAGLNMGDDETVWCLRFMPGKWPCHNNRYLCLRHKVSKKDTGTVFVRRLSHILTSNSMNLVLHALRT